MSSRQHALLPEQTPFPEGSCGILSEFIESGKSGNKFWISGAALPGRIPADCNSHPVP